MTDWTALEQALDDRGPYKWSELVDRDTLRALLASLREAQRNYDTVLTAWAESRERHLKAEADVARLTAQVQDYRDAVTQRDEIIAERADRVRELDLALTETQELLASSQTRCQQLAEKVFEVMNAKAAVEGELAEARETLHREVTEAWNLALRHQTSRDCASYDAARMRAERDAALEALRAVMNGTEAVVIAGSTIEYHLDASVLEKVEAALGQPTEPQQT